MNPEYALFGQGDPGVPTGTAFNQPATSVNLGLGNLWDKATGAFSLWMDVEKYQFDKKLATDQAAWEKQIAVNQAPVQGVGLPAGLFGSSMDLSWVVGAVVLVAGGLLAYKLLK